MGTQGLDASTQGYAPYLHHGYYGKRSADAYYGVLPYAHHAVAAHVPFGSSTGLDPITQGLDASTQGYAPYAHHYYGKRSADPLYAHHAVAYAGVPFGSSTGLDPPPGPRPCDPGLCPLLWVWPPRSLLRLETRRHHCYHLIYWGYVVTLLTQSDSVPIRVSVLALMIG